jgi:hypothetical protein
MERWIRGELSSPLTWSGRFTVGQTIVLSHRIILAFCEKVLIVSFFFFLFSSLFFFFAVLAFCLCSNSDLVEMMTHELISRLPTT